MVQLGVLEFCFVFVSEYIFSQFGIKVQKNEASMSQTSRPQCCRMTKLESLTVNMFRLFQLKNVGSTLTEGLYLVQHLRKVQPNQVKEELQVLMSQILYSSTGSEIKH